MMAGKALHGQPDLTSIRYFYVKMKQKAKIGTGVNPGHYRLAAVIHAGLDQRI